MTITRAWDDQLLEIARLHWDIPDDVKIVFTEKQYLHVVHQVGPWERIDTEETEDGMGYGPRSGVVAVRRRRASDDNPSND